MCNNWLSVHGYHCICEVNGVQKQEQDVEDSIQSIL